MNTRVIVASGNEGKVRELNRLFKNVPSLTLLSMAGQVPPGFEVAETGATFEENAWLKALETCRITGMPSLADDSGLEVDALGGRPGVYSARYSGEGATDAENNALLLRELVDVPQEKRTARFRCALAFAAPSTVSSTQGSESLKIAIAFGTIEGRILRAPRGAFGFGYDPLFEPRCTEGRTTAEMSPSEKNDISHRAEAARAMVPQLQSWLATYVGLQRMS